MAGDWIKFEVDLPEKPEVWQIAGIVGIDADSVVGKLLKVWRWFDAHTEDGNALGVTYPLVDHVAGVAGFGEAMALCGWLVQNGNVMSLPHFDRHNGKTAKNRALTAKRVAKHKVNSNAEGNGNSVTPPLPREEKRREEVKKEKAPIGANLLDGISQSTARDFLAIRKAKKAPLTETALDGIKREAVKAGVTLEQALKTCCERGWASYKFEWLKDGSFNSAPAKTPPARKKLGEGSSTNYGDNA